MFALAIGRFTGAGGAADNLAKWHGQAEKGRPDSKRVGFNLKILKTRLLTLIQQKAVTLTAVSHSIRVFAYQELLDSTFSFTVFMICLSPV